MSLEGILIDNFTDVYNDGSKFDKVNNDGSFTRKCVQRYLIGPAFVPCDWLVPWDPDLIGYARGTNVIGSGTSGTNFIGYTEAKIAPLGLTVTAFAATSLDVTPAHPGVFPMLSFCARAQNTVCGSAPLCLDTLAAENGTSCCVFTRYSVANICEYLQRARIHFLGSHLADEQRTIGRIVGEDVHVWGRF